MQVSLLESSRSLLQTTECALLSAFAHGAVVWMAVGLTAGGRQLPANERDARVFFLLPPDRVAVEPHQTEIFQWGKPGMDLQDGRDLTHAGPGPRVEPQALSARGSRAGSGARGETPFGPVSRLSFDTIFSVLEVDRAVERYDWSAAPAYPPDLAALGAEGVVRALYVVDTVGVVDTSSVEVIYSDDPRFTESVLVALEHARFRPATKAGKAVRQLVQQQFRFKLRPSMGVPGPSAS
jgi:TonB family protein